MNVHCLKVTVESLLNELASTSNWIVVMKKLVNLENFKRMFSVYHIPLSNKCIALFLEKESVKYATNLKTYFCEPAMFVYWIYS